MNQQFHFNNNQKKNEDKLINDYLEVITKSYLFDRNWYLKNYPEVLTSGYSPEMHYLLFGGFNGYDPCIVFSSIFYLDRYSDVKEAQINPLVHYLLTGKEEGRKIEPSKVVSDDLTDIQWTMREYLRRYGKPLDLFNPNTFNEKIQIYKLMYREKNLAKFTDKYLVREHVSGIIGENYLIPLIGLFSDPDGIEIEKLPNQFIIKATHGSGWNILCLDKSDFEWESEKLKIREWLNTNFYTRFREWAYKNIEPRFIIEKLILEQNGSLPLDYKFFCFDGKPQYIQVDSNRFAGHTRNFYDVEWNRLPVKLMYPNNSEFEQKPDLLDEMLDIARKLSQGFPFVRVDLYAVPEIYFGELSFYPEAGFGNFEPDEWDHEFGKKFEIQKYATNYKNKRIMATGSTLIKQFENDYNFDKLSKVEFSKYKFSLFLPPRFVQQYQTHEEFTACLIRQMSKGMAAYFDIGAHIGFYNALVGVTNPGCVNFAFEPIPENVQILKKNISLNKCHVNVIQAAVSDKTGTSVFQMSEASDNSGFIANPNAEIIDNITVDVVKIDDYLNEIPQGPILIKIDVEGNELNVINGMGRLIQNVPDVRLIIEINPKCLFVNEVTPEKLLCTINDLGFDIFVIDDVKKKYTKFSPQDDWHEFVEVGTYRNLYCIKKEHSLNLSFFSHSSALAGAERSLLELTRDLVSKNGAICTVVLPGDGPLKTKFEELGVVTIICNYDWWCSTSLPSQEQIDSITQNSFENLTQIFKDIEKNKPDAIVTNTIVIPWGAITAMNLGIPHIWLVKEFGELDHDLKFYNTFQKSLELIKESSNYIVAISDAVYQAFYSELDIKKCSVAVNNFPIPIVEESTESFFNDDQALKIVAAGSLVKTKGQDDAVNAVTRLINAGHNIELCIVGDDNTPFGVMLKRLVQTNNVEDRIHFLGFTDNVFQVIEQADICLTCSRNEAFGRVTAEAMLLHKPVIGTNTGGTVELIEDGIDGQLYPPHNVDELVEKIEYFIKNPEKINEFGDNAYKNIIKKLSARPMDELIYKLGVEMKNQENPNSSQLIKFQKALTVSVIQELSSQLSDSEEFNQNLNAQLKQAMDEVDQTNEQILKYALSKSWQLTRPFRKLSRKFKRGA